MVFRFCAVLQVEVEGGVDAGLAGRIIAAGGGKAPVAEYPVEGMPG